MHLDSILQKPAKGVISTVAIICYGLLMNGIYDFSEYQASIIDFFYYQSNTVYLFAGVLLFSFCLLLFIVHYFNLHPVLISIATMLTLFYGNSVFFLVVSDVANIVFSVIILIIVALQSVRFKDASFAGILICLLNITIYTGLSNTIVLGMHIIIGSVVVLYALTKDWKITHHFFMFVLCGSWLFYFLGVLMDKDILMIVLSVLFCALYVWAYRKVRAAR